jgi:hypothetical protein
VPRVLKRFARLVFFAMIFPSGVIMSASMLTLNPGKLGLGWPSKAVFRMLVLSFAETSVAFFVTVWTTIVNAEPPASDPAFSWPSPPATTSSFTGDVIRTSGPSDSNSRATRRPVCVAGAAMSG